MAFVTSSEVVAPHSAHGHESVEQLGRRLDVDDRKHRRQVDQDVVILEWPISAYP